MWGRATTDHVGQLLTGRRGWELTYDFASDRRFDPHYSTGTCSTDGSHEPLHCALCGAVKSTLLHRPYPRSPLTTACGVSVVPRALFQSNVLFVGSKDRGIPKGTRSSLGCHYRALKAVWFGRYGF